MRLRLEIEPGETLEDACLVAQSYADSTGAEVEFRFNSVICIAVPNGDAELLAERQSVASHSAIAVRSKGGSTPEIIKMMEAA